MILSRIKSYLSERGSASLRDIALHLDADPEAVRGMLEYWVRKGRIRRRAATTACGTACTSCAAADIDIYEWLDADRNDRETPFIMPFGTGCCPKP